MTDREDQQERLLHVILRSISSEIGDTEPISPVVYRCAEELVKIVLDEQSLDEEEEPMEELCADMDTFLQED